jgi:flagellar FliL protein
MPEVKEQTQVDRATAPAADGRPAGRGLADLLPTISIYGIVSLLAIFAAYLVTVKVVKPLTAQNPAAAVETAAAAPEEPVAADEHGSSRHGEAEGTAGESSFHTIESVVVNPAGTAGTRFLSCSVNFEVDNKEDLKAFAALDVQIRDLLITILSSKTVDELADVSDRNRMRREILAVVNKLAAPAKAKAVYLTDFVLQ